MKMYNILTVGGMNMTKIITVAIAIATLVAAWMLFQSTPAPATEVRTATTKTVEVVSVSEMPICDQTTALQILSVYEDSGATTARSTTEQALKDGRCTTGNYKFYRTDLYDFSGTEDAAKFGISQCQKTKTGECVALQQVFFYEGEDETGARREGYTLVKQSLSPEGEINDWATLSF